jgi:hypothetical protein
LYRLETESEPRRRCRHRACAMVAVGVMVTRGRSDSFTPVRRPAAGRPVRRHRPRSVAPNPTHRRTLLSSPAARRLAQNSTSISPLCPVRARRASRTRTSNVRRKQSPRRRRRFCRCIGDDSVGHSQNHRHALFGDVCAARPTDGR